VEVELSSVACSGRNPVWEVGAKLSAAVTAAGLWLAPGLSSQAELAALKALNPSGTLCS
jgi:hypothetical protein